MAFFHYQRGAIDEARLRSVLKVVRIECGLALFTHLKGCRYGSV